MKTKLQQIEDGTLKRVELHLPTETVRKATKRAAKTNHKPKQYFEQVIINDLKNSM